MYTTQTGLRAIALQLRPGVYLSEAGPGTPGDCLFSLVTNMLNVSAFRATCKAMRVPIDALGGRTLGDVLREAHDAVVVSPRVVAGGIADGAAASVATMWRLVGEYDLDAGKDYMKGIGGSCWYARGTHALVSGPRGSRPAGRASHPSTDLLCSMPGTANAGARRTRRSRPAENLLLKSSPLT